MIKLCCKQCKELKRFIGKPDLSIYDIMQKLIENGTVELLNKEREYQINQVTELKQLLLDEHIYSTVESVKCIHCNTVYEVGFCIRGEPFCRAYGDEYIELKHC